VPIAVVSLPAPGSERSAPTNRIAKCSSEHSVHVAHGLPREAARLAVEAAVVEQVGVKPVEHPGIDGFESHTSEVRDHVQA